MADPAVVAAVTTAAQHAPTTCLALAKTSAECQAGLLGGLGMFAALAVVHVALFVAASHEAANRRPVAFFDIVVTGDDNSYSLSRLQVYLWTLVVAIGFAATTLATGQFATIPNNLAILMGVNLGAAVASTAITTAKANGAQQAAVANIVPPIAPPPPPAVPMRPPNFVRDIFYESGVVASLDLPRTQMFFWTIVTLITYIALFVTNFPVGAPVMPEVPIGMVALMGISHGAYLGAKAAR